MHRSLVAFSLTLAVAQACGAATITATAGAGPFDNPVTDVDGPAISGQVFAEAISPVDAFSDMTARSALDVDGNSALTLDGVYRPSGKPHLAGLPFPQVTDATTTWTSTLTNNAVVSKSYRYSFLLHPFRLANFDNFLPHTDPLATEVSFAVEVRANGILVFEAGALLRGSSNSHVLIESGTDLGGVFGSNEFEIFYNFAQYQATVPVGSAAPGESITVEAKLIAHTKATFDNSGGSVAMGDPLDLKGDPGVSAVIFGIDDSVGAAPVSWSAAKTLYR